MVVQKLRKAGNTAGCTDEASTTKKEEIKQSALYTGRRTLLCITSVCLKEAGKGTWDQDSEAKSLLVSFVALLCISSMGHLRDDITTSVGFCSKSC